MTTAPICAAPRLSGRRPLSAAPGFALIEVLISVVVLAFGLLGLAAMLMTTQKSNSSSYARQQAVQTAYDIVDRMRINSAATIAGSYAMNNLTTTGAAVPTTQPAAAADCSSVTCSAAQLAVYDLYYWTAKDLAQLPNGSGSIVTAASGANNTLVTVTVQWDDAPAQARLGAATATPSATPNLARFVVQTLL